ncbi:hypothetical protein [Azospirillum sp. sgz301742]
MGGRGLWWARVAVLALALFAPEARAEGGGGNSCPWAQDIKLDVNGKSLTIPQAIFAPKNPNPTVDGYELRPDLDGLLLRIISPRGDVWHAALTQLVGGKRCTVFYVGRATLVEDAIASDHLAAGH